MIRALASFVTVTAMAMAAVAAWDRGGNAVDRCLLVAVSVCIVLAVHLLPALSRRPCAWMVWVGCLLCAIYGHLTFLTHASLRAGEVRAQGSIQAVGTERQIGAAREALAGIIARPVSVIASELTVTRGWRKRRELQAELAEAKRAAGLRDELVRLAGAATAAEVTESADPVTARLAAVTGSSENTVAVAIGLLFAMLVELVGMVLWIEALHRPAEPVAPTAAPDADLHYRDADPVPALRKAVADGKLRATVAEIRAFLGCSQARAMELRRAVVTSGVGYTGGYT